MHPIRLIVACILAMNTGALTGQTIPAFRISGWNNAGYGNPAPSPPVMLDVTQFGATGNGVTDDAAAVLDAIDSLHGMHGVIYFPPGDYLIGTTLDLPDSVIIRGATADSTHIIFNLSGAIGNGFQIAGSESGVFTSVIAGADRGSNYIVVADPSAFLVGDYAELLQTNGSWDSQPAPWATDCIGQILKLTSILNDTLYFDAPLRYSYDTGLQARIQKITPAHEIGIECLRISRGDNVTSGVCYNIYFLFAAQCRIQGVESSISIGSHIQVEASTNISIRGCYIHHAYAYDGTSTHGYGITLFDHSGQCLLENNIMEHLRHSFSLQTGANGNVLAYNYSIDPNRSEFPSDYGADISLHGHFPFANLFEGNIVQNIMIDQTWGPSGPFNTFFRNRADLYGIIMTSSSDSMNFVGNEVTNTLPFMGQYALAGSGHFEYGNNIKGTLTPAGTTPLTDSSYFLNAPPNYWNTSLFPSIGIPNIISSGFNAAHDRIATGAVRPVCNDAITVSIDEFSKPALRIFPNPATHSFKIQLPDNPTGSLNLRLKDMMGRTVHEEVLSTPDKFVMKNPDGKLFSGIYILEITSERRIYSTKIILQN